MKKMIMLLLVILGSTGCFKSYMKVDYSDKWSNESFQSFYNSKKKFIIHFTDAEREMINPVVKNNEISGQLGPYKPTGYGEPQKEMQKIEYKKKNADIVFSEAHIYLNEYLNARDSITITPSNFIEMRAYVHNAKATTNSTMLGIGAIVVVVVAFAAVVAAATAAACNCPQVYVETAPAQYEFAAGIYSGAIMNKLERTDNLPLTNFNLGRDTIRLRITGYPGETQFINHASLVQVNHPEGTEVVSSAAGELFLVDQLSRPDQVSYGTIPDHSKQVWSRDGNGYDFYVTDSTSNSSSLTLSYKKKKGAKEALLVTRLQNTAWGGYVYHEFIGLFGNAYTKWISQQEQNQNPPMEWQKSQGLMMKVQVLTKHGWTIVDYFPAAGNTASRDMAMRINLDDVETDVVMIRMESAYRFWQVDHAGLSYAYAKASDTREMHILGAVRNDVDQQEKLQQKDDQYVVLDEKDELTLSFDNKGSNQKDKTTYVFVAGGYYHQKNRSNDPPKTELLSSLLKPGAFHRYSMDKFEQLGIKP